jgi:predicted anti-sigma-YlaC factor YlaD
MNHQLFEDWLLSEEPLSPEQSQDLREHLKTCKACAGLEASWQAARQIMRRSGQVAPAAGFTARWQERQEEDRRRTHNRQTFKIFSLMGVAAILTLLLLAVPAIDMLRSPEQLFLVWAYRMLSMLALADALSDTFASIVGAVFQFVPPPAWMFIFGSLSMVSVLWVVVFQQLTSPRRIKP